MTISKSPLDKFLSIFTEVRPGESGKVLLLALNIFLVLTAYYVIKPVREALILAGGGAEVKSYAAAGQALLFVVAVPAYAKLASSLPRVRLINVVTAFFVGCLVLFYVLAQFNVSLGVVFYLWVGIFNMMFIAQFWSFANDVYTPEAGKRLFAIVAFGASAGAVFGSFATGRLIQTVGVYELLLLAAAILGASLIITNIVNKREARKDSTGTENIADEPIGKEGAFRLVFQNKYLLLIAFLLLFLNWVNTTGEYILGSIVEDAATQAISDGTAGNLNKGQFIGKFYADFFSLVNLLGFLIQLFLVSRILKYLGVRLALMILPLIAFGGYAALGVFPILAIVRWSKVFENATDYSLQNTVRNVLFLPTTREEKYKAKQVTDTIFVRAGDVLSAGLVYVGTTYLAFQTKQFALVNLGLVVIWLVLAWLIGRENKKLTQSTEPKVA